MCANGQSEAGMTPQLEEAREQSVQSVLALINNSGAEQGIHLPHRSHADSRKTLMSHLKQLKLQQLPYQVMKQIQRHSNAAAK